MNTADKITDCTRSTLGAFIILLTALYGGGCDDETSTVRGDADGTRPSINGPSDATSARLDSGQAIGDGMHADGSIVMSRGDQGLNSCPVGQIRVDGECISQVCEPGEVVCQEGDLYRCDENGTRVARSEADTCAGRACIEGECRPIKHNVVILFDTSSSMNTCVDDSGDSYTDCCGNQCPDPWPICETSEAPLSRLGHSKSVFQRFFSDRRVQLAGRFALLTFPQIEIPFNNECSSSIYDFSNFITGDNDRHETDEAWFMDNLGEVVRVPFSTSWSEDNVPQILEWVDFVEDLETNPELRATGLTPLGRSMFYAGEYFRHAVIAEGRPCETDRQ